MKNKFKTSYWVSTPQEEGIGGYAPVPPETPEQSSEVFSNKNKKYLKIIETAKELFYKYGIKKVTIEEICTKANVSKMTFYKHFENKNELVKSLLKTVFEESLDEFNYIINKEIPFSEKIKDIILLKLKKSEEYSNEFIQDLLDEKNKDLLIFMTKLNEESVAMDNFINLGKKEGFIRSELNIELIKVFQNKIIDLFNDETFKLLIPDAHKRIEELMKFMLYGMTEQMDYKEPEVLLPSIFPL
ncbi:MAG: TetR/AcrR family transcriptional regulator [Candidatus Sericytochromatia bacterium]